MINCIIIEDEPLAHDVLIRHISRQPDLQLVGQCYDAPSAFEILHREKVDVMFLDVKMPGINGIDFLKSLKNPPRIIFTTAYSEYAVTGFELDAVDYLLKPITAERFNKSMTKLFKFETFQESSEKNYTYFKVSGELLKIFHDQILLAQSLKDYILLKTLNGNLITHMTMKDLTALLPAQHFSRVHRSYLINKNHIDVYGKHSLKIAGEVIPIGENYRNITGL